MKFKLWSQTKPEVVNEIRPKFNLRCWDDLEKAEKKKIWHFLELFFGDSSNYGSTIEYSILLLNEECKYQAYAKNYLKNETHQNARLDFHQIFFYENENVFLELISYYSLALIEKGREKNKFIYREDKETKAGFEKRRAEAFHQFFDSFARRLNDVFEHFSINLYLTRLGFVMRQDPKITEEVYIPVISYLSNPAFKEVNDELSEAFRKYNTKKPSGYSDCITHAVSSLEAYLQIIIYGKITKKKTLSKLFKEATSKKKIPDDTFSENILTALLKIFARTRKDEGSAHPKKRYSNEKNARLVMNLIMVFLQHCIQSG